jgi:hypothetical protein
MVDTAERTRRAKCFGRGKARVNADAVPYRLGDSGLERRRRLTLNLPSDVTNEEYKQRKKGNIYKVK